MWDIYAKTTPWGRLEVVFVGERAPYAYPYTLVRGKGLEPSHLSILDPKSSASTNSAILASLDGKNGVEYGI